MVVMAWNNTVQSDVLSPVITLTMNLRSIAHPTVDHGQILAPNLPFPERCLRAVEETGCISQHICGRLVQNQVRRIAATRVVNHSLIAGSAFLPEAALRFVPLL